MSKYEYNRRTGRYEWVSVPDEPQFPSVGIDNLGNPTINISPGIGIDTVNGGLVVGGIDLTPSSN